MGVNCEKKTFGQGEKLGEFICLDWKIFIWNFNEMNVAFGHAQSEFCFLYDELMLRWCDAVWSVNDWRVILLFPTATDHDKFHLLTWHCCFSSVFSNWFSQFQSRILIAQYSTICSLPTIHEKTPNMLWCHLFLFPLPTLKMINCSGWKQTMTWILW